MKGMKRFDSSNGNVFKYVFTGDDYIAESVLYRYKSFYDRTVICCSVQSGCPVGCTFCGTGKRFVRNLGYTEIVDQVKSVLADQEIDKNVNTIRRFQIMFMSMGEPFLNYNNVKEAIIRLHDMYPYAELLISTIAPKDDEALSDFIHLSCKIRNIGLQFSIHMSSDEERNELIPFKNKHTLDEIRDYGILWWSATGRHPYLNYCITGENATEKDRELLMARFSPVIFNFTFSVVCSADETMKDAGFRNLDAIREFEKSFIEKGYNTRIFDPAGQDDIGGGCGQLWYVQKWLKAREENA